MTNPIDFEKLVTDLYQIKLLPDFKAYHNKKYIGKKSQHDHQIDFSIEGKIADTDFLILGECKQYKNPVNLDKVMAFAYRIMDISAQKGILVSSNGFQSGAVKIAKSAGIALVICRYKQLDTVLARGYADTERNSSFFDGIYFDTNKIQYAILADEEHCKLTSKDQILQTLLDFNE